MDLFAALLIAAFAGFILMAAEYRTERERSDGVVHQLTERLVAHERREREVTRVRKEADAIIDDLEKALRGDERLRGRIVKCGEDACIDLYIHYPRNGDTIPEREQNNQMAALHEACGLLRAALDKFSPEQRENIELIAEGHADRTQVHRTVDHRTAYLYNWNLSSRRAGAVLFEFQRCGLKAPHYSVAMIGYADSEKVCTETTEACDQLNRRTTLRLRVDTRRIERRLRSPVG